MGLVGALGTLGRYFISSGIHKIFGGAFPIGTLSVNVIGCLLIGFLGTLADEKLMLSHFSRALLFIGFFGAFTTFSSFAYDTWSLIKDNQIFFASMNVTLTFLVCFIGLFVGIFLAGLF